MNSISQLGDTAHLRRGAAAGALIGAGLLHLFITPEQLEEKLYIGALFGLSVPLCIVAAVWLWKHDDRVAWLMGTVLCASMAVGFLLSRTVGLPGFDESGVWAHWTEGFPALAAEVGFLALAMGGLEAHRFDRGTPISGSSQRPAGAQQPVSAR